MVNQPNKKEPKKLNNLESQKFKKKSIQSTIQVKEKILKPYETVLDNFYNKSKTSIC